MILPSQGGQHNLLIVTFNFDEAGNINRFEFCSIVLKLGIYNIKRVLRRF